MRDQQSSAAHFPVPQLDQRRKQRFWSQVAKEAGACWTWTGGTDPEGYGVFHYSPRVALRAHRVAWRLAKNADPGAFLVCHQCDNPSCVRPSHLFLGTTLDNQLDSKKKGRNARGERHGRTRLSTQQVKDIRALSANGRAHKLLALDFNVTDTTISNIVRRKTWKYVE